LYDGDEFRLDWEKENVGEGWSWNLLGVRGIPKGDRCNLKLGAHVGYDNWIEKHLAQLSNTHKGSSKFGYGQTNIIYPHLLPFPLHVIIIPSLLIRWIPNSPSPLLFVWSSNF